MNTDDMGDNVQSKKMTKIHHGPKSNVEGARIQRCGGANRPWPIFHLFSLNGKLLGVYGLDVSCWIFNKTISGEIRART